MAPETRAQARRAEQHLSDLWDGITRPDVLGMILERLPGAQPWLTAGRLSKAWRQWASPLRDSARQALALSRSIPAGRDPHGNSTPLPLWFLK